MNPDDPMSAAYLETIEPIVAVKAARLVETRTRVRFAPQFPRETSTPYDAVCDAVCESENRHPAPARDCRCGFHAVPSRTDLWRLHFQKESVILDVELAGVVIEHEFGWRAGHQAILGVQLPATCTKRWCGRPVAGVAPFVPTAYQLGLDNCRQLRPVCSRCGKRRLIPIADLASNLCVEVTVDDAAQSMVSVPGA
jgi:hypothetical protein